MKKATVVLLSVVAAAGFFCMLGAEESPYWKQLLLYGFLASAVSATAIDTIQHPRKYYRHVLGLYAIVMTIMYKKFHIFNDIGRTLYHLKLNTGSYIRMGQFIADSSYYSNVRLEDYYK